MKDGNEYPLGNSKKYSHFRKGDRVCCTPADLAPWDNPWFGKVWPCSDGRISYWLDDKEYVFVKYYNEKGNMKRIPDPTCASLLTFIKPLPDPKHVWLLNYGETR